MNLHDFYYDLPKELIAQDPLTDRASSRLLVMDRKSGEFSHDVFRNITHYLKQGDCLVLNDTKVIPARLFGTRCDTNALIEILLLTRKSDTDWECLVKPGKKARTGCRLSFGDGELFGTIIDVLEDGNRIIHFEFDGIFEEILDRCLSSRTTDWSRIKSSIREDLGTFLWKRTGRSPMILPILMEA